MQISSWLTLVFITAAVTVLAAQATATRAPQPGWMPASAIRGLPARQETVLPSLPPSAGERPQSADERVLQIQESVLLSLAGKGLPDPRLQAAVDRWKEARTDEERAAARAAIREQLEREYESALQEYGQYLESIGRELAELREQASRRQEAREAIVDLYLEVIINEADGLGWPRNESPFYFFHVPDVPGVEDLR